MQLVLVFDQDAAGLRIALLDDTPHFVVDGLRRGTGNRLRFHASRHAKKHLTVVFVVHDRAKHLGKAPLGNHVARQSRRPLDVVGGARGHAVFAVDHLFGDATAEQARNLTQDAPTAQTVAVLFGQEHGHTQGAAARDDGDLVKRIVLRQRAPDDGMPRFVIGRIALFLLGHDHRLALRAHHDLVLGLFERPHHHHACPRPGGKQRRLVHDILEIRARKTRRAASDNRGIHVVAERHAAHMDLENLFPTANIRKRHNDLTIETPRA